METETPANGHYTHHDDGTYISSSTIDSPPREESDGVEKDECAEDPKQQTMFAAPKGTGNELDSNPVELNYGVDLKLTLKRGGDSKAITIPLLDDSWPSSRIPELLLLAVLSRRNSRLIDAALDLPDERTEKIDETRQAVRDLLNKIHEASKPQTEFKTYTDKSQPTEAEVVAQETPANGISVEPKEPVQLEDNGL